MDFDLSLLLYKQMILPCFEYCDFIVESGPDDLVKKLQTLQNHCLRSCKRIRDPRLITRTAPHADCSINRLQERRDLNITGLMYKRSRQVNNLVVPARVLRSNAKMLLNLERPKDNRYMFSPLYRGAAIWDKVAPEVQEIATYGQFMNTIKNK